MAQAIVPKSAILPAVFAPHTLTGEVAAFTELAGHLGEGQQVYGLQGQGVADHERPITSVEWL